MSRARAHWGLIILVILSAYGMLRLLGQAVPGHFRVFTSAARALVHGHNPYGTDFGTHVGDYFYSPACALYFFRPFTLVSEKLGLFLYMGLSWLVFVAGSVRALSSFTRAKWPEGPPRELCQVFWVAIAPQVFSAMLASKLELMMTGLLFFIVAWVAERRLIVISALLAAMITNWKFQPLPIMALIGVGWLTQASGEPWRRRLVWPVTFVSGSIAWYALPALDMGMAGFARAQTTWLETFSAFVRDSYLNFENLFGLLHHAFGLSISYRQSQGITLAVGIALLLNFGAWIRWVHPEPAWPWVVLLATGSGTIVVTALSPLGQNNALILYAPLLLGAVLRAEGSRNLKIWRGFLLFIWIAMTLSYSDITPIVIREELRYISAKAGACIILGAAWIASFWRVEWMRMLNERIRSSGEWKRPLLGTLTIVFAVLGLAHCAQDSTGTIDSQDRIFPQYSLSYDNASKSVVAAAVFNQDDAAGSRLTLNRGASIALDDGTQFHAVQSEPDQAVFYQALLGPGTAANTTKQYTFVFQDSSGDVYRNPVSFQGTIDLNLPSSLNLGSDLAIPLTTPTSAALQSTERVEIRIRQDAGKGASVLHVESDLPATAPSAKVLRGETRSLIAGLAYVRACRVFEAVPPQHAKAGGRISVSACSAESTVTLE